MSNEKKVFVTANYSIECFPNCLEIISSYHRLDGIQRILLPKSNVKLIIKKNNACYIACIDWEEEIDSILRKPGDNGTKTLDLYDFLKSWFEM
jgi:hypothetical protein